MPIDIQETFSHGGKELIDLLDYCIRSVQMDPLFVFLVQEYRQHPTAPKAVALYDIFCAAQAPAKVSASEMLPPLNLQIEITVSPLKRNLAQVQAARTAATEAPPLILPPKFLFDALALRLQKASASFRKIKRSYKPQRTPMENLPNGKMTAGQRRFVDNVWEPTLRPELGQAGFWRVTTIA